jgi:hypothetical protein
MNKAGYLENKKEETKWLQLPSAIWVKRHPNATLKLVSAL